MVWLSPATKTKLSDPRRILVFAAVFVLAGVVAGFLSVYDQADRTLALRQGPPAAVPLQHFDPMRNAGPAREVMIQAEADLDAPLVLSLRGSSPRRTALAVPLYRLSDLGAAAILAESNDDRIGVGPQVARRTDVPAGPPAAEGILLIELKGRDPESVDIAAMLKTFGTGRFGTVLQVNGQSGDPDGFALMMDGALSVDGMSLADDFVTVLPFEHGRLAALAETVPVMDRGRVFFFLGAVVSTMALVLSLWGFGPKDERHQIYERERAGAQRWTSGKRDTRHFEPLPSQEEVNAADAAEHPPSLAERLLRAAGQALSGAANRLARLRR